jgi:hypothetical protein
MVKLIARILGPAFFGLVFVSTAFADGITLSSNFPGGYLWYEGLPVAPYTSTTTIDGTTVASSVICLDINNPTNVGTFYSGTFYTAATISAIPGQASLTINDEVSWLADQLAGISPNIPANSAVGGPISLAIWQIEFPTSTNSENLPDPIDPAAQIWITDAAAAVAGGYQSDSAFFIPDDSTSQRFVEISLTDQPGTLGLLAPEPGTLCMMGTGLLGLAGLLRRKFAR